MLIQITCNEDEYRNTLLSLIPDNVSIVRGVKSFRRVFDHRLLFIKNNLSFPINKEILFRRLRKKGYSFGRKTLQRDLRALEADGVCELVITNGGSEGNFTKIVKGE